MIWYLIGWSIITITLGAYLYRRGHEDGWIEGYIAGEANPNHTYRDHDENEDFHGELNRKLDDIDIELSELISSHEEVVRELGYR